MPTNRQPTKRAINKMTRAQARTAIVQMVNRFIIMGKHRRPFIGRVHEGLYAPSLLSERHIQRAVCIARRNKLARAELLERAGFRP